MDERNMLEVSEPADSASEAGQPGEPRRRLSLRRIPLEIRKAALVIIIALLMTSAFAAAYTVALGRPVPRHISFGVVGPSSATVPIIDALQIRQPEFDLRTYPSREAAVAAVNRQSITAVLDASAVPPTLLLSSASDPSSTRVLTQLAQPVVARYGMSVVDLHPLPSADPAGLATFYVTIAATLLGFVTMFQLRANVKTLRTRPWLVFVVVLAISGGAALSAVAGPVLGALRAPYAELWLLISLQVAIAALFNSTMLVLIHRWAIIPTWGAFILLGNTSSGGAVSASLLPQPFALLNHALPTGATVSAIHAATYFPHHQRPLPFVVLGVWLCLTLVALLVSSRVLRRSPAE